MILEGNARGYGQDLAIHLLNPRDNDHVTVHAIEGFIADDLLGAFAEIEAISQATQCSNYLFSLSLNPPADQSVSVDLFETTIAETERRLGLVGQPRVVVFHEKNGRRHAHCVWSRISAAEMKAIGLPHYKRKLTRQAHEIFLEQAWDVPQGFERFDARDPLNCSRQEAQQAKRTGHDRKALKAMFLECWQVSDSGPAVAAALRDQGYVLARGDRRGVVVVNSDGKVWSLSRWCGVKPRELARKVGDLNRLPDVEEAVALALGMPRPERQTPERGEQGRAVETERQALVARQWVERADLISTQEQRRIHELKARHKGLRAVFLRLTGQYADQVAACDAAARKAKHLDHAEQQRLIDRHLAERRTLDRDLGLTKAFGREAQADPRQRLELPETLSGLSKDKLLATPGLILEEMSKTEASFTRTDVLRALASWIDDPSTLAKTADAALSSPSAVKLPGGDKATRYTTLDYQRAEDALFANAHILNQLKGAGVSSSPTRAAITEQNRAMVRAFNGRLSEEQSAAIKHVLGREQFSMVVGLAGAGKSTMLATAAEAWRKDGITVHGAALAGKAAEGLEEASSIPSRTLASLELSWQNGYEPISKGDVLVIDEAGMIGTRQLARITTKIEEIGAKLVLVGDPEQLQPIEAGNPFRNLVDRMGAVLLTEIHRQREDWQKRASRDLAEGRAEEALQAYRKRGAVIETNETSQALEALIETYAMDALSDPNVTRLAFAHRRKDVYALNQGIRAALRTDPESDVIIQTETGPRAFAQGDRIVFTRNDKALGVKNGMLGTVKAADRDMLTVTLDGNKPHRVTFNPRTYNSVDHGYATTIHKSQGATVDEAYLFTSRSMDRHLAYVAMSRHRNALNIFTSHEDRPSWAIERRQPRRTQRHRKQERSGPSLS
ncbi:MAG: AAA family ATPase [Pseudomonadota bacterium]